MEQKRNLSETIFIIIAMLISWFAIIFDFIQATTYVFGETEIELIKPLEYFQYMTIWSNLIIAIIYTLLLINRNCKFSLFMRKPFVLSAFVIYIFVVGASYHFMLANTWNPTGLRKVTDLCLHYIVPLVFILYWIFFVEKGTYRLKSIYKWLYYPFVYAIFVLIRGAIIHKYPYPFVDVNELGYPAVIITFVIFLIVYYLLGVVVWLVDRAMIKR